MDASPLYSSCALLASSRTFFYNYGSLESRVLTFNLDIDLVIRFRDRVQFEKIATQQRRLSRAQGALTITRALRANR
jgi:DNA polymerase sigma